jgi:recombination protein RecA
MAFDKKKKKKEEDIHISQSGDVQAIRNKINEQFKSVVAQEVKDKPVVIIPTGILSMDLAVGNGGLVAGRVMDIYGWEGTGKTLLCMTIGGYVQRCPKIDSSGKSVKRVVAFLDAEGTFSRAFALSAGMDADNLILIQSTPNKILTGEDFFDAMVTLIGQGVDYLIVDSCPALTPSQVVTNDTGQGQKATRAQLMASGLEKITPIVNANGQTLVHFVNQMRGKPMTMSWDRPEQETGGNALKFFSTYRFEVVRAEDINKKVLGADGIFREKKVGVTSYCKIIKNKTAPIPPTISAEKCSSYHFDFDVYFESFKEETGLEFHRGVDVVKDFIETGIRTGVIKQSSSWFSFGSIKTNGKIDLIQEIKKNPKIMAEIRGEVFDKMKGQSAA